MMGTLTPAEIEDTLRQELVGRIGCHADGRTYVVPISFAYDGASIYGHSYEGLKIQMMRQNPEVCFEVDHADNLSSWRSVIAWGHYEELHGDEAMHALRLLMARFLPIIQASGAAPTHGAAPQHGAPGAVVFRLRLIEKTGRCERVA